jgi:hypothetical protein
LLEPLRRALTRSSSNRCAGRGDCGLALDTLLPGSESPLLGLENHQQPAQGLVLHTLHLRLEILHWQQQPAQERALDKLHHLESDFSLLQVRETKPPPQRRGRARKQHEEESVLALRDKRSLFAPRRP